MFEKPCLILITSANNRGIYSNTTKNIYYAYDHTFCKVIAPYDDPSFKPAPAGKFIRPYINNIISEFKWLKQVVASKNKTVHLCVLGTCDPSYVAILKTGVLQHIQSSSTLILISDHFISGVTDALEYVFQKETAGFTPRKARSDDDPATSTNTPGKIIHILIPTVKLMDCFNGTKDLTLDDIASFEGVYVYSNTSEIPIKLLVLDAKNKRFIATQ
jgi:hypothetical protein